MTSTWSKKNLYDAYTPPPKTRLGYHTIAKSPHPEMGSNANQGKLHSDIGIMV